MCWCVDGLCLWWWYIWWRCWCGELSFWLKWMGLTEDWQIWASFMTLRASMDRWYNIKGTYKLIYEGGQYSNFFNSRGTNMTLFPVKESLLKRPHIAHLSSIFDFLTNVIISNLLRLHIYHNVYILMSINTFWQSSCAYVGS